MLCFKNGQFILYSLFYIFPFCNHAAITFVTQYIPEHNPLFTRFGTDLRFI